MVDDFTETKADEIKRRGARWKAIRDNATTPEVREYAEKHLEFLRKQLRAELAKSEEAR